MRKLIGGIVAAAVLVGMPALAVAQAQHGQGKHEFGADLGFAYSKPDGGDGHVIIGTPVDLRVGFVSRGRIMVEPRFTFLFDSKGGIDLSTLEPTSSIIFTPGLNLLFARNHRAGFYYTIGAGYDIIDLGDVSANRFSVNGGIGTRSAYESGAFRPEAFFRYDFENKGDGVPSAVSFGLRLGLSLWH